MARELEQAGLTTAMITPLVTIAREMGVNRIIPGSGIPYPFGDPRLTATEEFSLRQRIVARALEALRTPVAGPTVFRWAEA